MMEKPNNLNVPKEIIDRTFCTTGDKLRANIENYDPETKTLEVYLAGPSVDIYQKIRGYESVLDNINGDAEETRVDFISFKFHDTIFTIKARQTEKKKKKSIRKQFPSYLDSKEFTSLLRNPKGPQNIFL